MPLMRRLGRDELADHEARLTREWLVTNGLGGYASGTIAGLATRRYHGLLVAALPAPWGRRMLLSHLSERLRLPDGTRIKLSGEAHQPGDLHLHGADHLVEFRLEMGLPVWRYEVAGVVLEKRLVLPHEQNTTYVRYHLLEGPQALRLTLRPSVHHRAHDASVATPLPGPFRLGEMDGRYELAANDLPVLRLMPHGRRTSFTIDRTRIPEVLYPVEELRGYEHRGFLWTPGWFRAELTRDEPVALVASSEPWETVTALAPEAAFEAERQRRRRLLDLAPDVAADGFAAELMLAAEQFVVQPVGRTRERARAHAEGEEARTVIAGYHWFTDWGRDTMIALEGLTLVPGRAEEARWILRTFARFVRDGLLPNLFPEGDEEGLYHTADASLWFFHAVGRYLRATGDRETLERLLPKLVDIAEHHLRGTRFGIGVDPGDGLLRQGQEGVQLTWMDAKVGDWVVTPRRGKAVEVNALWYDALCRLTEWTEALQGPEAGARWRGQADRARASFNARFWYEAGGHLYDVVDGEQGDDPACRPNQVLAISLEHPVLERRRWAPVLDVVRERLLTPVGLRSLDPRHPDYAARYSGDLRSRDAAYHQGTVWAWLIGPFVDAWLALHPEDHAGARRFLQGFERHLSEAGIGSISEIFDAEPPYTPRGCVAQAWSVAEVLRCWVRTRPATAPPDAASPPSSEATP